MEKHYYITHQDELTKKENIELWQEIRTKGKFLGSVWGGDYLISTYEYNKKIYELWENMEYGVMSEIVEKEVK